MSSSSRKESLEPPANIFGRRRSWRDSLSWPFGGRSNVGLSSQSQSASSSSTEQSSGPPSSTASAFSHLSVSSLLGITGTAVDTATTKPKGEKARALLRLLLKSQRSPESSAELITDVHSLVPCGDVVGLLAVSVKQLKDFTPKFNVKRDTHLLVRISIDKIMKCTNPQVYRAGQRSNRRINAVTFGDVRYFSIKVPNQKSDSRNKIVLELVGFEGPKDFPRLFGTVTMHLYDVIQKQSFTEVCAMRIRNMVFCTVEVEFMFCYGSLGYGYSHQLKLPGADPAKAVAYSMFMRVPPPKDRKDPASNVITPQLMDYPAFLSSDLNVTVGNVDLVAPPDDSEEYKHLQDSLKDPPRERLVRMKQEYRNLKTWRDKAEYLDQLILKRGPKTKPGVVKMSRFKQMVGKVQHPFKGSTSSAATEKVLHEETASGILEGFPSSVYEIPVIPSTIPEYLIETESSAEMDREFPASADTLPSVPLLTVTSGTSADSPVPVDRLEDGRRRIQRIEIHPESETSLSSSSEIPAEFSDSHVETGDSESPAFESPEGKVVDEEPTLPEKKESVIEYPQLMKSKESRARLEVSVESPEEVEAPKPSESDNEMPPQWSWKEVAFQEAVFSGNKFEPFLRHIKGVEPPEFPPGKADETSTLSLLEKMPPYVGTKEQEDQDPPHQMSPTKADSSSDSKLVMGGKQLSILRLIEKNIELEEEGPHFPIQMEKEPKPLPTKTVRTQKRLEKALSESEVKQVHDSFKSSVEDFLVNRLTKVIALKSILSKHVENLVEERLLEAEVAEELEDSVDTTGSGPDAKGKHLLVGRKPCSDERLSEQDISNLKAAASENLQASLIGKLSAHGIISGIDLAENNQKVFVSAEEDLLKRKTHSSKDIMSRADIMTLKSLSDSQSGESSRTESRPSSQENQVMARETELSEGKTDDRESALHHKSPSSSLAGIDTEVDLDKACAPKSLEIIRVRLPVSSEADASPKPEPDKTVNDVLIEKLLKTEVASLKSFLSKGLQDHFKEKLSETGLSTKEDFEKVCQNLSLNVKDELRMALEKGLPEGSPLSSKENLPETRATKQKSVFNESVQNFVLDMLSEREVANLKSVLNKKIQDHLLERLSEVGLITEEELRKVLENFFPVVTKETLHRGNNKEAKRREIAHSTSSLTQSLQDRFSEEELKNLKSLLNRILKEDHRDKLSESEIKGLTSVLQKNFKDLPIQSSSETGISKEVEIKDECRTISLMNIEESPPGSAAVNASEKEKSHSKGSLSRKLGLDGKPDLPVNNAFEAGATNQETQTNGFMSPPKKVPSKVEKRDASVNSGYDPGATHRETQTKASTLAPKKLKPSSKRECHKLPSSEKPDMPNSQRRCETVLRNKRVDETRIFDPFTSPSLTRTTEPFASSSFLSAHDIGVQTELKNYLSKPPGYLSKPTFPVNPKTFLYLHSESEDEAKLPHKCHQKAKSKKKLEKSSKRDIVPHHPQPGVIHTQLKKEKSTSGLVTKDAVKERGKKHFEPPSPRLSLTDSKKDSKTTAAPGVVRVESLKLKPEKKRDGIKPKKSLSKIASPSDPHLQNVGKNLPDKPSLTKFPSSWHTTGNTPNIPGILDLDMETFKHLEKAIERALIDLGKGPEVSPSQAPYFARSSTAPSVAATAKELLRSLVTNPSAIENPRISASSLSETLNNQEHTLKMSPEQLEVLLWILQNALRRYTSSQNNG